MTDPYDLTAVDRRISDRTRGERAAKVLRISRTYATTVEDLWNACTDPDRIPRWLLPVTGNLEPGGHYQLEGNAGGTVERCEPPTFFAATWEYGGDVSWIEVTFSADGDGARMSLEHIADVDDAKWAEFGPGAVGIGWDLMLNALATHLTTAAALDPAEAMEWMGSADGARFMTSSSDLWFSAAVAAGAPPAAARAAADRTTAAYTASG